MQASRIGKISVVCVRFERDVGVCGVLGGEVGCEIVEGAVVRFADESNGFEEGFCCGGIGEGGLVDEAEAVSALWGNVSLGGESEMVGNVRCGGGFL